MYRSWVGVDQLSCLGSFSRWMIRNYERSRAVFVLVVELATVEIVQVIG